MGRKKSPVDPPVCSLCEAPAVVNQQYSCRNLCTTHFINDVEQRVFQVIEKNRMIRPGDRIAVALSGGKDSTALLLLLARHLPKWQDVSLIAVTVDEGIHGYRDQTIRAAERVAENVGVEHSVVSFQDLFSDNLDTLLKGREEQACTVCGILRKKALVEGAKKVRATKIATGHNLNDEAQSVLMNVLRGDLPQLVRNSGIETADCFLPRIKPLAEIPEKEVASYLFVKGMFLLLPECPYRGFALRADVRSMLSGLEHRNPGTMLRVMESKKKIEKYLEGEKVSGPLHRCRKCGDPCSGDLCQVCRLRLSLAR
jgi:uncharacterized protein (TIGR00269 family)